MHRVTSFITKVQIPIMLFCFILPEKVVKTSRHCLGKFYEKLEIAPRFLTLPKGLKSKEMYK